MVIQVLNSKLGITLRVSVTSATSQENHTQKICSLRPGYCIFVYGSLGREDGCRCDQNCNVIPSLEFKTCMTIKS